MIRLLDTLVSDDLKEVCFACDLEKCKGACCIDGDAGAPLEEEEIALIEDHIEAIKPFMTPAGVKEVEEAGVFDYDAEGKFVTPLVEGGECVFVYLENGITRCAIEKAFREKAIPFPKPVSCHLYPVRIRTTRTGDLVNYHEWHICRDALVRGKNENLPLYRFLEEALIRKYGKGWYDRLSTLLR
ncbi:MAG TPA: DUF3109 family protein [Bacteroidales bacterium]|nr:DUF3109 family protein [Bacteroidales bacterium]HPS61434.1 DUF3109 family protein [Bacteroidales bacterium]